MEPKRKATSSTTEDNEEPERKPKKILRRDSITPEPERTGQAKSSTWRKSRSTVKTSYVLAVGVESARKMEGGYGRWLGQMHPMPEVIDVGSPRVSTPRCS